MALIKDCDGCDASVWLVPRHFEAPIPPALCLKKAPAGVGSGIWAAELDSVLEELSDSIDLSRSLLSFLAEAKLISFTLAYSTCFTAEGKSHVHFTWVHASFPFNLVQTSWLKKKHSWYENNILPAQPYILHNAPKQQFLLWFYDPDLHMGIIHPLRMPYFSENNIFILDYLAKNTCNKSRNHLIVGKKASEILELIFCVLCQ